MIIIKTTARFRTWIHWSGITPSRPTIAAGATEDEMPDGFGLSFVAPEPPGDALHKSIPIFRLVAGIDITGFPGTEAWTLVPEMLFCALAAKQVMSLQNHGNKANIGSSKMWRKIPSASIWLKLPFLLEANS